MSTTKSERKRGTQTERKARTEPPWNGVLHNDWNNSMPRVVRVLRKDILGMGFEKVTAIMYEAHSNARAVVKRCHKELAELYKEHLQGEGLIVRLEPTP